MILRDFECPDCGLIHEEIVEYTDKYRICPQCGGTSKKIISVGNVYLGNLDAPWVRTVLEVVDKESTSRHTREFIKNPNRRTLKGWMKGEGLRHMEPGEKPQKPKEPDMNHITKQLLERKMKHDRLEVRG